MNVQNQTILTQASRQWASRPADERFLNLHELHEKVAGSREASRARVISSRALQAAPDPADETWGLVVNERDHGAEITTNWSFGQLASLARTPAGYMRKLPAPLAADCINYGLTCLRDVEDVGILVTDTDAGPELRAATGPGYGRIWNADIVKALIERFGDGRTGDWRVPGEFGREVEITRQNTTIYGSDRDMFVFLADEKNRMEIDNRRDGKPGSLARGFFVWNSEVGAASIGAAFFLFDFVCQNRIVWGVEGFKEHRIRHTSGAPDRWLDEVSPVLIEYAQAAASPIEAQIAAAQKQKIDKVEDFLAKRFSKRQAANFAAVHEREEGRPIETMWDAVTAVTAAAKAIPHTDERVSLEREGGKLLDLVAA